MSSRNLTQEEIDSYHRENFVRDVLEYISQTSKEITPNHTEVVSGKEAKFILKRKQLTLITISQRTIGEYIFSAGNEHRFTYRLGDLINFLEQLYDLRGEILSLKDEIKLDVIYVTAIA